MTYQRIWKEKSGGKKAQESTDKLLTCLKETRLLQTQKAQGSTHEFLNKGVPYVRVHFLKKELFDDLWFMDTKGALGNDKKILTLKTLCYLGAHLNCTQIQVGPKVAS